MGGAGRACAVAQQFEGEGRRPGGAGRQRARGGGSDLPAAPGGGGGGVCRDPQHEGEAVAGGGCKGEPAAGREVEPGAAPVQFEEDGAQCAGFQQIRACLQKREILRQDGQKQAVWRKPELGEARAMEAAGGALGGLEAEPCDGPVGTAGLRDQQRGCRGCRGIGHAGRVQFVQAAGFGRLCRGRIVPRWHRAWRAGERRLG